MSLSVYLSLSLSLSLSVCLCIYIYIHTYVDNGSSVFYSRKSPRSTHIAPSLLRPFQAATTVQSHWPAAFTIKTHISSSYKADLVNGFSHRISDGKLTQAWPLAIVQLMDLPSFACEPTPSSSPQAIGQRSCLRLHRLLFRLGFCYRAPPATNQKPEEVRTSGNSSPRCCGQGSVATPHHRPVPCMPERLSGTSYPCKSTQHELQRHISPRRASSLPGAAGSGVRRAQSALAPRALKSPE